jgi:uncharacterized protein YgiM (DUF1202 family)
VRQEPSGKSRILATVKQGEVHEVLQNTSTNEGMWYKLRLDSGTEGWVSGKYVRIQE